MERKRWYVVFTKPRREPVATENLERQGFEVYFPRLRVNCLRRNRRVEVVEPLFPRYLFIHLALSVDNLAPIRSTKGVCSLVHFGEQPTAVPEEIIYGLYSTADPQSGIHLPKPRSLRSGERVVILDGPMAGLEAIFDAPSGKERAILLLDLLGKSTRVSVPYDSVERV